MLEGQTFYCVTLVFKQLERLILKSNFIDKKYPALVFYYTNYERSRKKVK